MIDNLNPHTTQDKVQMAETILTDQNEVLDAREKEQLIDLVEGLSRFSQHKGKDTALSSHDNFRKNGLLQFVTFGMDKDIVFQEKLNSLDKNSS